MKTPRRAEDNFNAPQAWTMLASRLRILALLTCVLLLPAAHAPAQPRTVSRRPRAAAAARVVAADIFDAMYFRERADSDITAAALAAYANSLVARRGLDFSFDACEVVSANKNPRPAREVSELSVAYSYTLPRAGGGRVNLRLISEAAGPGGGVCGECFFYIPALRVTRREMLVVASGRRYLLERPAGFLLHEVSLVDESRRRVIRSWQLPFQNIPLGLSADRTKLYVPLPTFVGEEWDDKLALELSGAGVRFVARERLNLPKHEWLTGGPKRDDTSLMRYGEGAGSYVLRFTDPCT